MSIKKALLKLVPITFGLLGFIACNVTTDVTAPISSASVTQLQQKWRGNGVIADAPWNGISDIAWKPDGTKIAVSDFSQTYVTSLEANSDFTTVENLRSQIAWKRSGNIIAGRYASEVVVANLDTGDQFQLSGSLWGFADTTPLVWSPNDQYILGSQPDYLSSDEPTIWNVQTRQPVLNLGSQNTIFSYGWSMTEDKILVVGLGRGIYTASTGTKILSFPSEKAPIAGDFSPTGDRYAISYYEYTQTELVYQIIIYNTSTGEVEKTIKLVNPCYEIKWHPNGRQIGGSFLDGNLSIWDTTTGAIVTKLPKQSTQIAGFEWHPSGSPLAVASGQNLIFYNTSSGEEEGRIAPRNVNARSNNVYGLAYHPSGVEILEVGRDANNALLNASTGIQKTKFVTHTDSVYGVAYNSDGSRFVTVSTDGTAIIADRTNNTPISTLSGHAYTIRGVAWGANTIATASWDSTAKLWNPDTAEEIATIQHTDFVNVVAFNPNSTQVATGSSDHTLKISSSIDGTLIESIDTPAAILSLAWNSNGTQIAVGTTNKNVYVYDVASGVLLRTLTGHIGAVRAVLWGKNNTVIISGGDDGNLKLWDTNTSKELFTLKPAAGFALFALALSPDGNTVAVGTANGTTATYTLQ